MSAKQASEARSCTQKYLRDLVDLMLKDITFYRRLAQNLTQLDFSVGMLAGQLKYYDPNNLLHRAQINRVASDVKAVCEARLNVSELGDMEILEQLNKVCLAFQVGEDAANFTAGATAVIAAGAVVELGLLKKLCNDVALKAR